jgi:hypothetical protein
MEVVGNLMKEVIRYNLLLINYLHSFIEDKAKTKMKYYYVKSF